MKRPEFQVGDVVRLREEYLYDGEDIDGMSRLVIVGRPSDMERIDAIVLVPGAGEIIETPYIEEVGTHRRIDIGMYEIDPNFERGESK